MTYADATGGACTRGRSAPGGRATRVLWAAALTSCLALAAVAAGPQDASAAQRPNIVVVQTDDQDVASLSRSTMPNVVSLLKGPGTTFTNHVTSGPLCCPSRAVFLTGQYGHNNGVTWNNPDPYGDLRGKGNTLPVWLRRSGYRTAHVGRYLNHYQRAVPSPNQVAPGWIDWHTVLEPLFYFDYTMRVNGRSVRYGHRSGDYLTRVINRTAVKLIHRSAGDNRPLFLSVDQLAPHANPAGGTRCRGSATPDPSDAGRFRNAPLPRGPAFNETDVTDKPSFVRESPRLGPGATAELTRKHRCRLASLRAVDRGVGSIHRALRLEGELQNTAIVFTSDNGWLSGEHRVAGDKVRPYEESLRVPLIVRLPPTLRAGRRAPATVAKPSANIDIAPTILQMAGARPCRAAGACRTLDGRSLLPLLRGSLGAWPAGRGILLELEVPHRRAAPFYPCDYEGIRTSARTYIEHHSATGAEGGACRPMRETELYDLLRDPFQLSNLSPAPPGTANADTQASLAARLARLRDCRGIAGRDPRPPGGHYCE